MQLSIYFRLNDIRGHYLPPLNGFGETRIRDRVLLVPFCLGLGDTEFLLPDFMALLLLPLFIAEALFC